MSDPYFDGLVTEMTRRYGDELGPFLARRIATRIRRTGKDPCMDNLRACDTAKADEVQQYEKQLATGCCGFVDFEVTHFRTGRTFRLGFNYGH